MYGIINKSIGELVIHKYGKTVWDEILLQSNIAIDNFLSNEAYDDAITFTLASTIALKLNISVEQVLMDFGKWWILETCNKKYGAMLKTGGVNLSQFLENLPNFHDRVQLMYPKLSPPEFRVVAIADCKYKIFYSSKRVGLSSFMNGLLNGLGEYFKQAVAVESLHNDSNESYTQVFEISWKEKK